MATETALKAELLDNINAYLQGRRPGQVVAAWATELMVASEGYDSPLFKETIEALAIVGHDDPRWDTPVEDLEYLRDCLLGKREFVPPVLIEKGNRE